MAQYDIREDLGRGTIKTSYVYDLSGRLAYTRTGDGESYRYTYDLNDNLIKSTQTNEHRSVVTQYTYDADNRETSTKTASKTYSTAYDALGRITSRSWNTASPYTTAYTYQPGAEGSQSAQVQSVTAGNTQTSYTYDANGNITSITSGSSVLNYAYDERNQLIREDNSLLSQTIAYDYDLGGNIKTKKIYSYQPDTSDEAFIQLTPVDTINYGYDSTWKDKLISYDGQSITYDAIGNPLSYRGMTLIWKRARELSSITKNGQTYSYRYNKDGLRINKYLADGTVSYQYDGSLLVGEQKKDSNGNLVYELEFIYDSTGSVIALLYNGTEYYYEKNLQGDIVGILNSQGERIVTYQYDSWGELTGSTGDSPLKSLNPLRYRGYYYDSETGLYYLNSRYYDAEVGRFISADTTDVLIVSPIMLTDKNLYAYCDNNPVMRIDADGEFWNIAAGAVIGAVISGTVQVIDNVISGKKATDGLVLALVGGAITGGLAATGAPVAVQALVSGIVSGGTELITQVTEKKNEKINMKQVLLSTAIGAVAGAIGGNGIRHKSSSVKCALNFNDKVKTVITNRGWSANKAGIYLEQAAKSLKQTWYRAIGNTTARYVAGALSVPVMKRVSFYVIK